MMGELKSLGRHYLWQCRIKIMDNMEILHCTILQVESYKFRCTGLGFPEEFERCVLMLE